MANICIICAIKQETAPLLQRFPAKKTACLAGLSAWRFQTGGHSVTLIQSGIGGSNAAKAAAAAVALTPEIIISAGFCGALKGEVAVGELFLAEKLYDYAAGTLTAGTDPDSELNVLLGTRLKKATFITTTGIAKKTHLYALLPDPTAAHMLEMESSNVAAVCRANGIRFIAIRSVSDTAEQDPGDLFQLICDNECNIRINKVALALIKKPSLLPEFFQLYRNTALAGKTLSAALAHALEDI